MELKSKAQEDRELEEKILYLRKKEYSVAEIAVAVHIGQLRVVEIVKRLISQGRIDAEYQNLKRRDNLERQKKALELIEEGKSVKEIAENLCVSLDTVYTYVKNFIADGTVSKDVLKKNADKVLENKVLDLRKKGYSKSQIMYELKIGRKSVVEIIRKLVEDGELNTEKLPNQDEKYELRERRKDQALEFVKSGYTMTEISRMLAISVSTTYHLVNELVKEGRIGEDEIILKKQARMSAIEPEIAELLESGSSRQEITHLLHITYAELNPIVNKLIAGGKAHPRPKEDGRQAKKQEAEARKIFIEEKNHKATIESCRKKMEVLATEINTGTICSTTKRQYFNCCKKIVECGGKLEKVELDLLSEAIAYGDGRYNPEDLGFIGVEYAKLGDYKSAIRLSSICMQIYGEDDKTIKVRAYLIDMQKKQKAHDLMKQGQPVRKIMEITGLSEVDILKMQKGKLTVVER